MIEYLKAVAIKAAGTASVTFLAGFSSEAALNISNAAAWVVGAQTAVAGAIISVVIPALNKVASKAAATKVPDFQ